MFNVPIDTCVWLKIAEDYKYTPLLQVVQGAVAQEKMKLLVPRQVLDEFKKNRARVLKTSERRFSGHLQEVRKAITKVGGDKRKTNMVLAHLADVDHKLPQLGRPVEVTLDAIEKLLTDSDVIEPTDGVRLRAADRALDRRAPCQHDNKNSVADAVILETYNEAATASSARQRFAFVTDNYRDFSVVDGDYKLPHPDIARSFSKIRSMYFINLAECLRKIDPSLVSEVEWFALQEQPRGISELLKAHELLFDQVWYNRHKLPCSATGRHCASTAPAERMICVAPASTGDDAMCLYWFVKLFAASPENLFPRVVLILRLRRCITKWTWAPSPCPYAVGQMANALAQQIEYIHGFEGLRLG